MSMLDMAMGLANSQAGKIAKVLGKPEAQVKSALQQATKLIPEITQNPTPEGGAKVLSRMGIDKKFLDDAFNRFSPYASKIPGLNKNTIGNALSAVERAMDNGGPGKATSQSSENSTSTGFDFSKYPRIK